MKVWMLTFGVDVIRLCITFFFFSVGFSLFKKYFSGEFNYNSDLYEFGLKGITIVAHDWVTPYGYSLRYVPLADS